MGGIADYSGALVLQLPLACTTTVTVERQRDPRVDVTSRRGGAVVRFGIEVARLTGDLREPADLRRWILEQAGDPWPAYVLGVIQWCLTHRQVLLPAPGAYAGAVLLAPPGSHAGEVLLPAPGMLIAVESTVPEGSGVSSSAALEVATMRATLAGMGASLADEAIATACQWVENHVVGAPCGIMDQMTSACGRAGTLLRLRCQPATIEGFAPVPAGYRFYGIDSGLRHAVSGADYGTVRAAAFMGLRMLTELASDASARWGGYLANCPPGEFARWENALPERITGRDFLQQHGGTSDPVTTVDAARGYPVRQATRHPVLEHQRVERFLSRLGDLPGSPDAAIELGRLMRASHDSYGACGLGCTGTDRLVAMIEEAGPGRGLFGARITGGGSGGTVAVLGTVAAEPVVREIAARYAAEAGRGGTVFV